MIPRKTNPPWKRLVEAVQAFRGRRVVVLGDMVLDRFWHGDVQRVSREAPVPIVRLSGVDLVPGCAANTVSNLAALGAEAVPVGVVGTDPEGDALAALFAQGGIRTDGLVRERRWTTPTKTRILAGNPRGHRQQLVRVDSGEQNEYPPALRKKVRTSLKAALAGADALIFSDYGYGVLDAAGAPDFKRATPITAVDSRFALSQYRGVVTATPNEEEFEGAVGRRIGDGVDVLEQEGASLRERLGLEALLVTRGKRGMALFERGKKPLHIGVVGPDQVIDVTGAGDTVMASYVLSLCAGATFEEAAWVANIAGGIVVQKFGTATTDPAELVARIRAWGEGKI
jgi:D-glycero-beta-D-manno-heptose-7-phosphate kinase